MTFTTLTNIDNSVVLSNIEKVKPSISPELYSCLIKALDDKTIYVDGKIDRDRYEAAVRACFTPAEVKSFMAGMIVGMVVMAIILH